LKLDSTSGPQNSVYLFYAMLCLLLAKLGELKQPYEKACSKSR
jgi:hypothetical protein